MYLYFVVSLKVDGRKITKHLYLTRHMCGLQYVIMTAANVSLVLICKVPCSVGQCIILSSSIHFYTSSTHFKKTLFDTRSLDACSMFIMFRRTDCTHKMFLKRPESVHKFIHGSIIDTASSLLASFGWKTRIMDKTECANKLFLSEYDHKLIHLLCPFSKAGDIETHRSACRYVSLSPFC